MKILLKVIFCFLFFACGTKQNETKPILKDVSNSYCPDDGICAFTVFKNASLTLKKDHIGKLYPDINNGSQIVLQFEYKRHEIDNVVDGSYSEFIYLEFDSKKNLIDLTNIELQEVKLLFARLCFCRGQTGYYKITNGHLSLKKIEDSKYTLDLSFKIDEVPQVITTISETFNL